MCLRMFALTNVLFWYLLVAWEDSALLQLAQASAKTFEHFFQIVVVNLESWWLWPLYSKYFGGEHFGSWGLRPSWNKQNCRDVPKGLCCGSSDITPISTASPSGSAMLKRWRNQSGTHSCKARVKGVDGWWMWANAEEYESAQKLADTVSRAVDQLEKENSELERPPLRRMNAFLQEP